MKRTVSRTGIANPLIRRRMPLSRSGGAVIIASTHGRRHWLAAMMLFAMMLFAPQRAGAVVGSDWGSAYSFLYRYLIETENSSGTNSKLTYNNNNNGNNPYVEFTVGYGCQYMGYKEGFMQNKGGLDIYASKDNGASWTKIINIYTDQNFTCHARDQKEGCDKYGNNTTTTEYTVGTYYHQKIRWNLPLQWRNCNIKLKCVGNWCFPDGTNNGTLPRTDSNGKIIEEDKTIFSISTPYQFSVRDIQWDGDYTIAPDGTVTVPYKFAGSAKNTDGATSIYTQVNGSYNGNCGKVTPSSNYSAGTYTFKLSAIGKSFRSDNFTIEPYHEFRHDNDKDASNGVKYYKDWSGAKTIHKLPKAVNVNVSFDQDENQVRVRWQSDHTNYSTGNWDTKWAIYRDGVYLASVKQDVGANANYDSQAQVYTFIDDACPHKDAVEYEIYYIWIGWDEQTARVEELKSDVATVCTSLAVPVNNLSATSGDDRVVFTWNTDAHQANWGHEFRIFVDNETEPIAVIKPTTNDQTQFSWIHRTTDQHTDRQSGVEDGIPYTEEPLNACSPHDYRVESWFDNQRMDASTLTKRAIGTGTLFYSADATKGVYAGMVKLSWHVNLQGSTDAKTYIIERRVAENESEPWETINTGMTSREERLTWTDDTPLPGVYYDYRLTVQDKCADNTTISNDTIILGFAQTTGTLSGRITFGAAGTAVAGVDVVAKRVGASASGDENQYHAMRFTATNGAVSWEYPDNTYANTKFASADFSMQMWICPDEFQGSVLFARLQGNDKGLGMTEGRLWFCDGSTNYNFDLYLKKGRYNHVTLTRKGATLTCYITDVDEDGNPTVQTDTQTLTGNLSFAETPGLSTFTLGYFKGYVDDFRLWTKCLTKDEILENYDHLLVGNEAGLETYWTFDEGLRRQFFDSSRSGIAYHNHHGKTGSNTEPNSYTASALKLKAKTDLDGNYIIQGVPFQGEGTTYAIIPQLGIHEFNPTQQLRFVSNNSLVHNGTDFTDVSSFPVSGTVYYSGTTYPVEGVNFYVDGVACTKDGAMVTTNSYGEYTISVPIGQHFIQAKKNGHEFVGDGRYPADPTGTGEAKANFGRAITGLEFRDTTLVNFTGRVVGGDIEGDKAVGFAQSQNNIGVARLTLTALNTSPYLNAVKEKVSDTSFEYNPNPDAAVVLSATDQIQSHAWRGAGIDECRNIYIETDPQTGEFSAMLPPLEYAVGNIVVGSTGAIVGGNVTIDLTNPLLENADTLHADTGDELYTYNTKYVEAYHSEPVFTVSQIAPAVSDGLFGVSSVDYKDATGSAVVSTISEGSYVYDHAIFKQGDPYTFQIEGYEKYENFDANATNPVVTKVPLKNSVVTIYNALSNEQAVIAVSGNVTNSDGTVTTAQAGEVYNLKSNQLQLDDQGKATYKWKAGLPNVAGDFTRTIAMSYDVGGRSYQWTGSGMKGIILGNLPTGNNFVTSGPSLVNMILRDPPGTGSTAEWTTGSVTSTATTKNDTWSDSFDGGVTFKMGVRTENIAGVNAGGTMVATSINIESKDDLTTHAILENEGEDGETIETTVSITRSFSTSGEPDYVGANGDVFIGQATNIVFGNARNVGFTKNGTQFGLRLKDVIATSLLGGTTFAYTQGHIENYLLPNFKKMRSSMLQTTTQEVINSYSPQNGVGFHDLGKKKGNLYYTTKSPTDEDFGKNGTYTVIIPRTTKAVPDTVKTNIQLFQWCITEEECAEGSVNWINQQITNWEDILMQNEREKVRAFQLRNEADSVKYENYSFNGGASMSYSVEKDSTHVSTWEMSVSAGVLIGNHGGFDFSGWGLDTDVEITATGGRHEGTDSINSYTSSFSYTLAEEGIDALTVDVYEYGAFGPIFRTRGGQTSNPYEDEVRTKYYVENNVKPVIMEKTMQIEVPQIDVDVNTVSDIPTGSAANYTLRLSNASEIGEDVTYKLFFLDETNPQGAQLTIDGKTLTAEGRLIKVPGNQTLTKMLQLRQTDTSVLDYTGNDNPDHELFEKGIGIVFASESQPEEIADTVFIKAYFTPSSSAVDLALSARTLNTQTGSNLTLTFSGFDRNYHNLKAFRLQYKKEGATDWTQLREYVLNQADKTDNNELLPESGATVSYTLPMSAWSDGNYLFRVVSAATYGNSEVYRYSEEIALVKDMQKPRPMGQPEPSDGVLDIGDDVSITFNEAFVKGELTKANNFTVTGVLNGAEIAHETALSMNGGSAAAAAAQTEAGINLANKDFSIDAWVNINGPGMLLSHGQGTNKLTVGTDTDGKLTVNIAGQTYTSSNSVPAGEWAFLTMNVTADGKLSANVATANETTALFTNKDVASYAGNGPLSVGNGAEAAIHELLLWDEAHDMTTALANRSKSKNPSTRHLIGYWKMDEGEGKTIRDYARSRHLTMPSETWYINNENKAVSLDGDHYVSINTTMLPITEYDDYAVEFWMRGGQQTGEAQLMQMGDVALSVNADGNLMLTGKDAATPTGTAAANSSLFTIPSSLLDNAWHHVALNVLRQGAAAVYVDGQRCLTTNAANVGGINGDRLVLGVRRTYDVTVGGTDNYTYDRAFKGEVDEVRVWGATMNGDLIAKQRKVRFTGTEGGLMAYYPFETKTLDTYNQVVTLGTPADLTGSGLSAELKSLSSQPSALNYTDDAPALRTKPTETNVNFTYVTTDEKIVIEIDEDPANIEGTTLNFNVRNLRDINGNYSAPAVWSAFINRKELEWADDALSITQQVNSEGSVTATIVNKGGTQQMWTLSGLPSWLTASTGYGSTNPRSETTVTFTVSPATPIGKYEETVYLTGNNGIDVPLTIRVKVTGDEPLWAVNTGDYEETMNIISSLYVLDVMSEDEDDLVGAFIGGECRGVARPAYNKRYDSFFVTMDIYGNQADNSKDITFKVYDASTGIIYPVVNASMNNAPTDVSFVTNDLMGVYKNPVVLNATDEIEQNIDLAKGWNWMSLSVRPDPMTTSVVFANAEGRATTVKNTSKKSEFDDVEDEWYGTLQELNNREMFLVGTTEAFTLSVTGHRVNPADVPITVDSGWNWLGYNGQQVIALDEAFAGLSPQDGDIVKGQKGVAYYDEYEWIGSLRSLSPGKGYKLKSMATNARTFTYPASAGASSRRLSRMRANDDIPTAETRSLIFTPVDYHAYTDNMVVIAQVARNGTPVEGVELGFFAADECRETATTDEFGMVYVTVPGNETTQMNIRISDGQYIMTSATTLTYVSDAVVGSPKSPLVIDLLQTTGIMGVTDQGPESIYDISGRKIAETQKNSLRHGVYIVNGQKTLVK